MERKGTAATKAKNKYNMSNYDRLYACTEKGKKSMYEEKSKKAGYDSLNKFIIDAIEEKISRM